jgi:pimeloyl-ACP methyl ester carboxylesterase
MSSWRRLFKSLWRLLLPIVLLILLATVGTSYWLVRNAAYPPKSSPLMTPESFARLSERGARITEETWSNNDQTTTRGWLLRGQENAPTVVLLHRYGKDRSWVLNMGVKLNEATNFTVLMPDLRGHGLNPPVKTTCFGGCEAEDLLAALTFLRSLKTDKGQPLIGRRIGVYGIELGGYAAFLGASRDKDITAVAVDSVPSSPNDLFNAAIRTKSVSFFSEPAVFLADYAKYPFYYDGSFRNTTLCDVASTITDRNILLLGGRDEGLQWRESTANLERCLGKQVSFEKRLDLMPTGFNLINTTGEQAEVYDQQIIGFFKQSLAPELIAETGTN